MLPVKRADEQDSATIEKQRELIRKVESKYGLDPKEVLARLNKEGGREAMLDYMNSKTDEAVRGRNLYELEQVIIMFKEYTDKYYPTEDKKKEEE